MFIFLALETITAVFMRLFIVIAMSLSSFCAWSFRLELDHPYYIPEFTGGLYTIGAGIGAREIEYDSNEQVIDYEEYKYHEVRTRLLLSPWKSFAFGIIGQFDFERQYQLSFGPASTRAGDSPYESSASGPLDPEVFFIYEFNSGVEQWNQQIYLSGNPFDIEESPRRIFRGGHDVFLEYRFSYKHNEDALYGKIFSHYFGKKSFFQPGDPRISVTEAYTEVGINLGYLLRLGKSWSLFADGTFGLSSDYNIKTPEIERSADKGYMIFAKAGVNYFIKKNMFLQLASWRGSRIYNANEEVINRNIDYEIEDEFHLLTFNIGWGSLL